MFTCAEADARARKCLQTAERRKKNLHQQLRPAQYVYDESAQMPTDDVRVVNGRAVLRFQLMIWFTVHHS